MLKADSQYDTNAAVNTYEWQVQGALCKFCILNSCVNVAVSCCEPVLKLML